jgi:hypothetical protein
MWFIVHLKDGEMEMGTVHKMSSIHLYLNQNNLTEKDCKIFDGHRLKWNDCYKEWDHAVISSCSKCNKDTTGLKQIDVQCDVSLEDGCPYKGDGGW